MTVFKSGLFSVGWAAYLTCRLLEETAFHPRPQESRTRKWNCFCWFPWPRKHTIKSKEMMKSNLLLFLLLFSCLSITIHLLFSFFLQQDKSNFGGTGKKCKHVKHERTGFLWDLHFCYNSTNEANWWIYQNISELICIHNLKS